MIQFVLVNESTLTDLEHGGELTPAILSKIATACVMQLNGEFTAVWGGGYSVRVAVNLQDVRPNEVAIWIQDAITNIPDAIGYHDRLANGAAVSYISRAYASDLTSGARALSVTISHEILETAADPAANRWVDRTTGVEEALEVCDRVQDICYAGFAGVSVSDFLLPSAFDPGAKGPYSFRNSLEAGDTMTEGGYALVRSTANDERQVTTHGQLSEARLNKARHPSSRAYRRGARL